MWHIIRYDPKFKMKQSYYNSISGLLLSIDPKNKFKILLTNPCYTLLHKSNFILYLKWNKEIIILLQAYYANRYIYINKYYVVQGQIAVTAYFWIKQLLLSVSAEQYNK